MNQEVRICQNCKQNFTIEPEDFDFYKKIDVPPPTWCPPCRQMRRYGWRNERVLYRRNCDLCGKSTVTIYSPNKPYKVYCPPCWWSDKWSAFDYGQNFDFSHPFFEQFKELQLKVPRIALLTKNSVNSEYTNHSNNNKNCYLCFGTFDSENILYSTNVWQASRDCCDCFYILYGGELLYECVDTYRSYRCEHSILLRDCSDCLWSYDCRGCSNCFLSWNLRNKQYYILNVPYSKEEYLEKTKAYHTDSYMERQKLNNQFLELVKNKALHRFAIIEKSNNVSGNVILNSKNAHHVFDAEDSEDLKHVVVSANTKTAMDSYHYGFSSELIYESHALIHSYDVQFSHLCYDNSHLQYCDSCHNSQNLLGCVGTKAGTYAIFNKKYSEQEYHGLHAKIIAHMKETGEFGEFFPPSLSPFGYNETQGQIYMPLTKEEAEKMGWRWEEKTPGTFGKETLKREAIPDRIDDVRDSITEEILGCASCGRNYNIVRQELDFYRRKSIPIPRLCPGCRYLAKVSLRPPRKLFHRHCMCDYSVHQNSATHAHHPKGKCPNEFETPYAPPPAGGQPEIVYCEQCYTAEVA